MTRYLGATLAEPARADRQPDADSVHDLISRHVHDIAGAALSASGGLAPAGEGSGIRAARLHAIRSHILEHLDSDRLTPAAVAAHQGITPRYLHKLFETDGTTYSAYVLMQRLARVHWQLTDPRFAVCTISGLAFDAGFGDLSYFNRAFKRRYGATPTDIRRRA